MWEIGVVWDSEFGRDWLEELQVAEESLLDLSIPLRAVIFSEGAAPTGIEPEVFAEGAAPMGIEPKVFVDGVAPMGIEPEVFVDGTALIGIEPWLMAGAMLLISINCKKRWV